MDLPTFEDVVLAHERIAPHVHRTPVLTCSHLNILTGADLVFKCENFQKVGAFKARGACNAVFGLSDEGARAGVATHSSGNHGQAVAYSAAKRGIAATVVIPSSVTAAKRAAVVEYGGRVIECAPTLAAREAALAQIVAQTGADAVHPYDDARVIAGQATCFVELHEDAGPFDAVIAPVGGGGLISGTCLAAKALAPKTEVYAGEPEGANDAWLSLKVGRVTGIVEPTTIADGLRATLGELPWEFVKQNVAEIFLVSDAEIIDAMRLIWERMKIIVEPSCAVPVAALMKNREAFAGRRVGVILTGGNVDLDRLPWLTAT